LSLKTRNREQVRLELARAYRDFLVAILFRNPQHGGTVEFCRTTASSDTSVAIDLSCFS